MPLRDRSTSARSRTSQDERAGLVSLEGGLGGEWELWFFVDGERVIAVTWDQERETTTH